MRIFVLVLLAMLIFPRFQYAVTQQGADTSIYSKENIKERLFQLNEYFYKNYKENYFSRFGGYNTVWTDVIIDTIIKHPENKYALVIYLVAYYTTYNNEPGFNGYAAVAMPRDSKNCLDLYPLGEIMGHYSVDDATFLGAREKIYKELTDPETKQFDLNREDLSCNITDPNFWEISPLFKKIDETHYRFQCFVGFKRRKDNPSAGEYEYFKNPACE